MFPADAMLRRYGHNLASHLAIDDTAIEFYLSILTDDEIVRLIGFLKEHAEPDAPSRLPASPRDNFLSNSISSLIFGGSDTTLPQQFRKWLADTLRPATPDNPLTGPLPESLTYLIHTFDLSADELAFLGFYFLVATSNPLKCLLDSISASSHAIFISWCTCLSLAAVKVLSVDSGRLVSLGLLNFSNWNLPHPEITPQATRCFLGSAQVPFHASYTERSQGPGFALESFSVAEEDRGIISKLLAAPTPCNVLLYGQPGTGKSEFSKSLAASVQKTPVFLKIPISEKGSPDRRFILQLVTRSIDPENELLVIDEADALLNSRTRMDGRDLVDKGWLNLFLESVPCSIIWITNTLGFSHDSVRRRFSFSVHFGPMSPKTRRSAWSSVIASAPRQDILSPRFIEDASKSFSVTTAGIAQAVSALTTIDPELSLPMPEREKIVTRLLSKHQELTTGSKPKPLIHTSEVYDLSVLNTDFGPEALCEVVSAFYSQRRPDDRFSMNLLFHGHPGTGKTEFAHHLAETTGHELVQKRASDLLSMWVGGTEAAIAAAFADAEDQDAILLLDEADTLFINRQDARSSWERSQTNELLTQMEAYSGILICCTNLLSNLDHAALRRFAFKVAFKPLTRAGRLTLFRRYFPEAGLTAQAADRLARLDSLTPGDFKAVLSRMRFRSSTSDADLITELETECSYKRQIPPIGFRS